MTLISVDFHLDLLHRFSKGSSEDDTPPEVVHISLSNDTKCRLSSDATHFYRCKCPDSVDNSLFADLLLTLVDVVTNKKADAFLEFLDPSSEFLRILNFNSQYRRKLLSIKDKKVFEKVHNKVANFEALCFSNENHTFSLDILMNSETDPTGEVREAVRKKLPLEERLDDDDLFSEKFMQTQDQELLDKEDVQYEQENLDDGIKGETPTKLDQVCYFPSQIEMATILKKRIDTIMKHYHHVEKLSDAFDDLDFVIYTARYRMLSEQTEKRMRHPDAGVLPQKKYDTHDGSCVQKRMFMYILSEDTEKNYQELQRKIRQNPRTLFVVIADECHWGITKGGGQKPSAHNLFINEWCKDNIPKNAVVVQISATPFNLLTANSRLPKVKCELMKETTPAYQAGDLKVLKDDAGQGTENMKTLDLHVAQWSEVELKNFKAGMRMKLKSALQKKELPPYYLTIFRNGELGATLTESEACEFVVEGSYGIVTIRALVNQEGRETEMPIIRDDNGTLKTSGEPGIFATFEVKLEFGVGIVAFSWTEKSDQFIAVSESGSVTLQTARVERECGVLILRPKQDLVRVSFEFHVESPAPREISMAGHQYMSLNYYLGTINCRDTLEKKIRQDAFFQDIVDKAKTKSISADAVLCADYCYHILLESVYGNNETLRWRLSGIAGPAGNDFKEKLDALVSELEHKPKEKEKLIPCEAFDLVRTELQIKITEDYKEALKHFQILSSKNTSGVKLSTSWRELVAAYLTCLTQLPQEDFSDLTKKFPTNLLQRLRNELDDDQTMFCTWADIVKERETRSMMVDLITSGRNGKGKMKIVRAKTMESADQFFYTLKLAREVSELTDCFEIIRDYGGMQIARQLMKASSVFFQKLQTDECMYKPECCCKELKRQLNQQKCGTCWHVHKPITQYDDLENLACVLILVDKGRMGDTFPQSFNCLDLRLSYDSKDEVKNSTFISSVIQELGRMCRYAKVHGRNDLVENIPYALVGRKLFRILEDSVTRSPAMSAIRCSRVDRYMTKVNRRKEDKSWTTRWLNYEASKDSFDYCNTQKHFNRVVLQAEPQIGKTGTYLCLIKQLREDVIGEERKVSPASSSESNQESFYLCKDFDSVEEPDVQVCSEVEDWEFPFWKTVKESPSLLQRPVAPGKYSISGRFYTHETEENPFFLMKRSSEKPIKFTYNRCRDNTDDGKNVLRAWHWYHFESCAKCGRLLLAQEPVIVRKEFNISDEDVSVTFSMPNNGHSYIRLLNKLTTIKPSELQWGDLDGCNGEDNTSSLSHWIFHPSHRDDPRKCTLNYHHVMKQTGHTNYVQAVVVQSEKFEMYRCIWGKVLILVELPQKLSGCDVGPNEGGVGYARRFIQQLSYALRLQYIFVIDDNVAMMSERVFDKEDQSVCHGNVKRYGNVLMQRCSFLKPLVQLERLVKGTEKPPSKPFYELWSEEPEASRYPLYTYTGPAKLFGDNEHESYGVLGFLRSFPNVVKPFAKTQVYAMILLNVKSTVEKGVLYRAWPCWEDLRFNDDCDKASLWVVKFNRYFFRKLQFNDWIKDLKELPDIFMWQEDTILQEEPTATELPKNLEKTIILHYIDELKKTNENQIFKGKIGGRNEHCEGANLPTEILSNVDAKEWNDAACSDGGSVFVLSYDVGYFEKSDWDLVDTLFTKPKAEKMVFVINAEEGNEKWSPLSLKKIKGKHGICWTESMRGKAASFAMLSAADPRQHKVRWILIEVSFEQGIEPGTADQDRTRWAPRENELTSSLKRPFEVISDEAGPSALCVKETNSVNQEDIANVNDDASLRRNIPICGFNEKVSVENKRRLGDVESKNPSTQLSASKECKIRNTANNDEETPMFSTSSSWLRIREESPYCSGGDWCLDQEKENDAKEKRSSTRTREQQRPTKKKDSKSTITGLSPDDVAYVYGANIVTESIVKLWREKKRREKNRNEENFRDLDKSEVERQLKKFDTLEEYDEAGYNALLKACSLPSTSSHLMQYLIVTRKVDINCQLPLEFDRDHPAANGLIPGMCALSVAIRRGNVNCVPTFKNREFEICISNQDVEGNTTLHHCIFKSSKFSFKKLFPLYKNLKWQEMRNTSGQNPFDLVVELSKTEKLGGFSEVAHESFHEDLNQASDGYDEVRQHGLFANPS